MESEGPAARTAGAGSTLLAAGLALAVTSLVGLPGAAVAQESGQSAGSKAVYRVGVAQEFSAALDSAPQSVGWEQLRQQVAIRFEGAGGGDVQRRDVVFHAVLLQNREIANHHTSESVEILPGATKFDPDAYLPEGSMIPQGMRIQDTMGFGVVEIPSGEIMSSLLRDIIMPMTEGSSAIYLIALPPDDQRSGSVRAYPVLVQLGSTG
jgi:hypothetical protein